MSSRTVTCAHCGHVDQVPAVAEGRPRCGHCQEPLPWIADAGDSTFADVAEHAAPLVVVDFWAAWCGPCRISSPALEQVARERAGTIKLVRVDLDRNPRLAERFGIQAVPTQLILDRGETVARRAGAAPAATLRAWVDLVMTGLLDCQKR
ncbi:thioredoxin family protein [Streptomyces coffeae]|uniref:Thioredoxin fold domain-containing protein n=1 Tax=Streptomyces coffeae TaxID=621382 RepID=A0ABS1NBL2_9ACTN|nr:thioredoxin domain-containing protein [Streptomyces coffeae]MBL1097304.1 thioredoxin fold domain-containing protein [Streptomyces coffeae]